MQDRVGREGEEPPHYRRSAPPCAKAYFLRVLERENQHGGLMTVKEMETLCHVLDHLAMGRVAEASDMVFQRLKALEMSVKEGWEKAKFVELLSTEKVSYLCLHFLFCSPFPTCFVKTVG